MHIFLFFIFEIIFIQNERVCRTISYHKLEFMEFRKNCVGHGKRNSSILMEKCVSTLLLDLSILRLIIARRRMRTADPVLARDVSFLCIYILSTSMRYGEQSDAVSIDQADDTLTDTRAPDNSLTFAYYLITPR